MPQHMRETQRVPRTCIQCARRKVKCSKKIPCDACIRRGESAACAREVVTVHGKVTVAVDEDDSDESESTLTSRLVQENLSLRTRIRQLESVLQRPEALKPEAETEIFRPAPAAERSHSSEKILNDFQRLPFGLLAESSHDGGVDPLRPRDDQVLIILPAQPWSEVIVQFSLKHLAWVHCALEPAVFAEEHRAFWEQLMDTGNSRPHGWNAVYLSVLAVGVYFMNDEMIEGFQFFHESYLTGRSGEMSLSRMTTQLCRIWCDAAVKELEHADYVSKPSVLTVQALTILNIVHKNLGQSSREYILHGLAVNVARLVGLDRLGEGCEIPHLLRDTQAHTPINVYRRLWWTLVIVDWMTVWSRPISIHPGSFTTILETSDESYATDYTSDSDVSSPFEYHKAMAQLAATMQNTVRSIKEWSGSTVQASVREIDSAASSFPRHLLYNGTDTSGVPLEGVPSWMNVQRFLVWNLLDTWRINLSVALIPQLLGSPNAPNNLVHASAVSAAKRILQRRYHDPCSHFQKFWAVACSAVTAGTFLCLDLICFGHLRSPAEITQAKELILVSIQLLESSYTETRHGALLVLRRLAYLHDILHQRHAIDQRAFANIMKLMASPRLWTSVADTESTLNFLFGGSDLHNRPGEGEGQAPVDDDTGHRGTPLLHDGSSREGFEPFPLESASVPDFEDFFGASELIDMSLPWIDPATLMVFTNHVP
ncbi:hypothetical protein BO86DRAFT_360607 [Aspergillus japonicus CBS 114.51]|uniref:Zn(2)-C6 fungal-type domain-containing protein n=1 Tax=Aspergillus japonicus CBS 114.51 TaxID=1448312 RepID=A0A8T8X477_ASPJA|nr:hypothetical protein BO86DRAFT_360607 [Aspergillus japonicus CBS 114.51]RAH82754.1 hypothetical protein BO86DRAFT_360607 [Aspergillus japonicus CBS 114.51]